MPVDVQNRKLDDITINKPIKTVIYVIEILDYTFMYTD